jgi:hypothetical protein
LICNTPEADTQNFTVIFTVKLGSASIGAGLQAIRQEATFRDLSTSIDSSNHRGHRRRRIGVGQGNDQEGLASNALLRNTPQVTDAQGVFHAACGAATSCMPSLLARCDSWR